MAADRPAATAILRVPSGTTQRFATLVVLTLASTLHIYGVFATIWPVATFTEDAHCQVRANLYLTSGATPDPDESKWNTYRECMSALFLPRLGWLLTGLLLLALAAVAIYYARPAWRVRRSRLQRIDQLPALWDKLREPLTELVATAGLAKPPEFLLDASSLRAGGVAFGHRRRPRVCLDAGLVALLDHDRPTFEAVVLHELAHVRNNDIATTYATLATWRAFLIIGLLPYLLVTIDPFLLSADPWHPPTLLPLTGPVTLGLAVRLAALVLLVYLARTAVLRSRERYADALVATWTGTTDPYRALAEQPRLRRVLSWIATHPSRAAREAAMRDPKSLLRPGFWEVLASGLAIQLAWAHLVSGLSSVSWYHSGNESFTVMRYVWGIAVGALVCVIAWRGAAHLRAGGTARGVFALPGAAMGLGLALGMYLQLQEAGEYVLQPSLLKLAVSAVLIGVSALVCVWAGHCARLLGEGVRTWRGLAAAAAVLLVCVSCLGWIRVAQAGDVLWQSYVQPAVALLEGYAHGTAWSLLDAQVIDTVVVPFLLNEDRILTAAALAALWLVPLLLASDPGRRVRLGLLAAGVGTLSWAVLVAVLRLAATGRGGAEFALVLTAWEIAAAVVVQFVLALLVLRRADWSTAALATWTLGVLACLGIWALHWTAGGQVDSIVAARPLQVLPFAGTAVTVLAVALVRPRRDRPVRAARPGRLVLAGVVAVSAFAVIWWPTANGAAPLLPPEPTSLAMNETEAVNIWIYGGGMDTFTAVGTANNTALQNFSTENLERIVSGCADLQPVLRRAEEFPKPPVARLRGSWTSALTELTTAAGECVKVYRDQTGNSALMTSSFRDGVAHLGETLAQIKQATEHAVG
ncbi:hypothetical protein GCM10010174_01830 [Kutzneria viridogrisea]|uniref:Zn-dependent protease with chaperone function n=1 Tax=Kutzneria viridogrisea TaxID=47990 RepID=A0ABR6BCU4_9PSEU|nr:Zn-dependent protease with chaperone function [Kutzneria viridogrisea]